MSAIEIRSIIITLYISRSLRVTLLYKKEIYDKSSCSYEKIDNMTIIEIIEKLAHCKVKDYKSLTNKTIFKFMDMIDM